MSTDHDAPDEREWLERSLDRWYVAGLACIVVLLAAFPFYAWREPGRLAAAREEREFVYIALGEKLFGMHCESCHGVAGGGGRGSTTLRAKEYLEQVTPEQMEWAIAGGRAGTAMVAWAQDFGGPLTMEEVRQLSSFIRSYDSVATSVPGWKTGAVAPPPPTRPAVARYEEGRRRRRGAAEGEHAGRSREGGGKGAGGRGAKDGGGAPTTESAATRAVRGESTWGQFCFSCHVVPRGAAAALGPVLISREYLEFATDQRLDSLITRGVPGTTMIGWGRGGGGMLNPSQVQDVIAFLRARQATAPSDPGWKGGRRVPIP
jgi:mono/diheme cytochrome c family protein